MKIALLTNEYPPHVYGGAGVHVEYLSRELARAPGARVEVLCFGDQAGESDGLRIRGVRPDFPFPSQDPRFAKLMDTLSRNLYMSGALEAADIIHCHTWYTHFAGCLLRQLLRAPLVLTTHSLEPHRPWKVEQLGAAYNASLWLERTAYANADGVIAVSRSMERDVREAYGVPADKVRVIPNGIDPAQYRRRPDPALLARHGIDPARPILLFVGRITRQKGVIHLLNAVPGLAPGVQTVLCAGAPDTPEIGREMEEKVRDLRRDGGHDIIWIPEMLPKDEVIALYSMATVFICPSVYEPFGIINLEAMACGTPVVASAVGGIPEVVVDGETGALVPFRPVGGENFEPADPGGFARALAAAVNRLVADPQAARAMGAKARERVERHFSWASVAARTQQFYQELMETHGKQ